MRSWVRTVPGSQVWPGLLRIFRRMPHPGRGQRTHPGPRRPPGTPACWPAGHTFNILLKGAFPINVLNAIKMCPEVCRIFCATANPLEVIVAETAQGRGILGVVDGLSPKGLEGPGRPCLAL